MAKKPHNSNLNSLKNLEKRGRTGKEAEWGEKGVRYNTFLTQTAKDNLLKVVKKYGYKTVPDFLEHVGRGLIELPPRPEKK